MSISLAVRAARARGMTRRAWRAAWLITYVPQLPLRLALLINAAVRHDAFILSSDTWVHRRVDLPLLRLLRKRVVLVFTGSDHRPPYLDGWFAHGETDEDWRELARATRKVRERVAIAERYTDEIVAPPASAHFHTKPIIDFLRIGIPFQVPSESDLAGVPCPFRGSGVRILHSPSNTKGKGTARIRGAIEDLRARGHEIDYVEIMRRPNREVLAALRDCDFVVDEVFSDTPMATFATEAAAFGKPTVVTGYYAELIGEQLPREAIPPTLYEMPERLMDAIEQLVRDEPFRLELGEFARRFVLERWSSAGVARRYIRILDREVPEEWRWDPAGQRYLYGWGMAKPAVAGIVTRLVAGGGVGVLGLRESLTRDLVQISHAD